jgi:hypothetical protein
MYEYTGNDEIMSEWEAEQKYPDCRTMFARINNGVTNIDTLGYVYVIARNEQDWQRFFQERGLEKAQSLPGVVGTSGLCGELYDAPELRPGVFKVRWRDE